jgi:hypothetical protein
MIKPPPYALTWIALAVAAGSLLVSLLMTPTRPDKAVPVAAASAQPEDRHFGIYEGTIGRRGLLSSEVDVYRFIPGPGRECYVLVKGEGTAIWCGANKEPQ